MSGSMVNSGSVGDLPSEKSRGSNILRNAENRVIEEKKWKEGKEEAEKKLKEQKTEYEEKLRELEAYHG